MEEKMKIKDFRQLKVWQEAHRMAVRIYQMTKNFPSEEKFGLTSQMRRAAVSVAANIVEGFRRRGTKEKVMFYGISQGSADELSYFLILSRDLGYVEDIGKESEAVEAITKMLSGMIRSIGK